MAPSRSAVSITWSAGTNRNSACGSTNFLMSQGHATRSTLTFSRVIHFMADSPDANVMSFRGLLLLTCFNRLAIDQSRDIYGNDSVFASEVLPISFWTRTLLLHDLNKLRIAETN